MQFRRTAKEAMPQLASRTASNRVHLLALCLLTAFAAQAEDVIGPDEYDKRIKHRGVVAALGESAFGDSVSLATGNLQIVQTDVVLPGNGALDVRVGRKFPASNSGNGGGHFEQWDLDIPYVHGTFFAAGAGSWATSGSGANTFKRCSQFSAPKDIQYQGGSWAADEYWHGSFLYLPGAGEQELLLRSSAAAGAPSDGASYPVATKELAVARCLPNLATTSEPGAQGEGFEVVAADGTVYTFDHMVIRPDDRLVKNDPDPNLLMATAAGGAATSNGTTTGSGTSGQENAGGKEKDKEEDPVPSLAYNYVLPRNEVLIYPSRVTDRFGNQVTYTWSTENPWRLLRIAASDGRHLDFSYSGSDPTSHQVVAITDGTRTWSYTPTTMIQPDGRVWTFSLGNLKLAKPRSYQVSCDAVGSVNSTTYTGTITAPSGASVAYIVSSKLFGRSWVSRQCVQQPSGAEQADEPYLFAGVAISSKTITGPGLPGGGLTWSYQYGSPNHCWDPVGVYSPGTGAVVCSSGSAATRSTTVTSPEGHVTRYTFGNRYKADEGMLLRVDHGWNGTNALRSVQYAYADPLASPYAALNGTSVRNVGDFDITSMRRPQREVTTTQQGRTFTWQVASSCGAGSSLCFDVFARPTKVVKSSSP